MRGTINLIKDVNWERVVSGGVWGSCQGRSRSFLRATTGEIRRRGRAGEASKPKLKRENTQGEGNQAESKGGSIFAGSNSAPEGKRGPI